jgi:uncharacterized lipoprotein YmbA
MKMYATIVVVLALGGCSDANTNGVSEEEYNRKKAEFDAADNVRETKNVEDLEKAGLIKQGELLLEAKGKSLSKQESHDIITDAGHSCDAVIAVKSGSDSTIATCADGERYRVLIIAQPTGQNVAMKCSAMEELGVKGGC